MTTGVSVQPHHYNLRGNRNSPSQDAIMSVVEVRTRIQVYILACCSLYTHSWTISSLGSSIQHGGLPPPPALSNDIRNIWAGVALWSSKSLQFCKQLLLHYIRWSEQLHDIAFRFHSLRLLPYIPQDTDIRWSIWVFGSVGRAPCQMKQRLIMLRNLIIWLRITFS